MTCLFSLKEEFPAWYEKLVLEMVHHNTASLEKLVDTAWLEIMTKYAVGEECDFEVSVCFYLFLNVIWFTNHMTGLELPMQITRSISVWVILKSPLLNNIKYIFKHLLLSILITKF